MFMFAAGYALANRWGKDLSISSRWFRGSQGGSAFADFRRDFHLKQFPQIARHFDLDDRFPSLSNRLLHKRLHVANRYQSRIYVEQRPGFDSMLVDHPKRYLLGYFQSPRYFDEDQSRLQALFTLNSADEQALRQRHRSLTTPGSRSVMIHVRRDDSLVPGNDWAGILSTKYFHTVMREWDTEATDFLVFSDSPDWCQDQPAFRHAQVVHEPDPVVTMRLMSFCDDFIIAGSTLSWWGAWLGQAADKKVIAPVPFFRRSSKDAWAGLLPLSWELRAADWSSA